MWDQLLEFFKTIEPLKDAADFEDRWRWDAVNLLESSDAFAQRDIKKLQELAKDVIAANQAQIALAHKYPDIYHENVAKSREIENEVYLAVMKLS